ncbi:MAG TPA: DUF3887 domain-containing protein [Gammaproteobacteria bacterium]|nr:DUF3887 domain-containing protein [Gammaproteobacteria bacterium]
MTKSPMVWAVSALLFLTAGAACAAHSVSADGSRVDQAKTLIHEFASGQFAAAEASFTPKMKQALPSSKIKQVWRQLTATFGPYQGTGETDKTTYEGYTIVYMITHFKQRDLRVKVVTDNAGKVAGVFFVP